jgi:glycerol-3-phosphate dehydrogenase (NAD(P)+)
VRVSADGSDLAACDILYWAVPTQHSRAIAEQLRHHLAAGAGLVSLSKGLEQGSEKTPCQLLEECLGPSHPVAVLSGPSHAEEIIGGKRAGLVAAGPTDLVASIQRHLAPSILRVYSSEDRHGVELAGALKNIIAIAAGIGDGAGLGDNLKATLITRGLAEMRRLGRALGCNDATFAGLAGVGDLLTTCYSAHSRNRSLGLAIGAGGSLDSYLADTSMVPEGAWTAKVASGLGDSLDIQLPIASQVAQVLWDAKPVRTAIEDLFARDAGEEDA